MVEPNIMYEKEYYSLRHIIPETSPIPDGYINYDLLKSPQVAMMNLHGHQKFIENLFNPTTPYKRLLLYHGTGTGKTLIINAVAKTYIDYFKRMKQQPNIFIIGFTENIVIKDLMKYPELGFITRSEIEELNRLSTSNVDVDIQKRRNLRASIRRRITDKAKGGYYKFYGYREFANHLFNITPKGVEAKITHSKIYDETSGDSTSNGFSKRIDELISKGYIEHNRDLLDSLKYSFIACDEVHLTYNVKGKNSGGMSIKYMLDLLEKEDSSTAPRVLYGSATPLSGSPAEAVDLAELLVPMSNYSKSDYFITVDPPKFKPDGISQLGKLFDGYVSFLKDTTKDIYPTRIFEGVSIPGLPYLKFIECPMSNFQLRTLMEHKKHDPNFETLLSSESMSLYDIVFPNPDANTNSSIGLYNISDLENKINSASDKWKQTAQIDISSQTRTPSGQFLHMDNLGIYSTKYETLLESLIDLLDSRKPGKVIVYHYMVRGSGILLLYNMLLENGFIGATSAPVSNTRCAVCGVVYKDHGKIKDHLYRPARVMLAYGELGNALESNYTTFNSSDNIYGYEYRILLASRVIHEGVDFKEIRYMYVLSLPKDISTLIQLMGRAVRGYSHHRLPIDQRDVHISILVSTMGDGTDSNKAITASPEVKNYQRKLALFLLIQEVEREMRRYAVDNFINYTKMKDIADKASLEGLPYKPAIEFDESKMLALNKATPNYISTFYNHGYAQAEIETLIILLKKLFAHQPIWTYDDLLDELRNPKTMLGTIYDHITFSEQSFKIALAFLLDVTSVHLNDMTDLSYTSILPYMNMGNSIRMVTYCDPYYILTGTDEIGAPILDYNQFMRSGDVEVYRSINVNLYVRSIVEQKEYSTFIDGFMKTYEKFPELSLIRVLPKYHYTLMSDIITSGAGVSSSSNDYKKVVKIMEPIYKELGILFTYDDFVNQEAANSYGLSRTHKKPIGYRTGLVSYIYTNNTFIEIQSTLIKTTERKENDIVIGFMKIRDDTNMEFIMRQPIQQLVLYTDKRKINKGASCNTYSRAHRRVLANKLKIELVQGPAMCEKIEMTLFRRELKARMDGSSSKTGLRWFYLPMDIMPNLSLT